MLIVTVPSSAYEIYCYAGRVLFEEILGLSVSIRAHDINTVSITSPKSRKVIELNADFAIKAKCSWGKSESMPQSPLNWLQLPEYVSLADKKENSIPVIYGSPELRYEKDRTRCDVDILGSSFFMLSRYEEFFSGCVDTHGRFPAAKMLAVREGFITRPVVNEYAELLWYLISKHWPNTHRKKRSYRFLLSCDVDHERDPSLSSFSKAIRRVFSRIVFNYNVSLALSDFLIYFKRIMGVPCRDNYQKNLSWMVTENAKLGCSTTFNFIPIQTHKKYDPIRIKDDPETQKILVEISRAGHLVGFHPGYGANKKSNFEKSWRVFNKKIRLSQVDQTEMGGRCHYLRFQIGLSEKLWQDAGLTYDSSLGFTDIPGFRAGICQEYAMFDLRNLRTMDIRQRPLILMDHAINNRCGVKCAKFKQIQKIIYRCKYYCGDFTLLWHNSSFVYTQSRKLYLALLIEANSEMRHVK